MPHPLRLAESQVTRLACELRTNLHATFKTRNTPLSLRRANACCIIASPFINTRCCCSNLATETKAGDKKLSPTCQCRWRACAPHAPENGYRQSFSKTSLQINRHQTSGTSQYILWDWLCISTATTAPWAAHSSHNLCAGVQLFMTRARKTRNFDLY